MKQEESKTRINKDDPWGHFPDHIVVTKNILHGALEIGKATGDGEYQATYVLNSVHRLRIKQELEEV